MKRLICIVAMACVVFAGVSALAQDAQQQITDSRQNVLVKAIQETSPAVVSVNVIQVQAERVLDPAARDFWGLFYAPSRIQLREQRVDSVGSGFVFDDRATSSPITTWWNRPTRLTRLRSWTGAT